MMQKDAKKLPTGRINTKSKAFQLTILSIPQKAVIDKFSPILLRKINKADIGIDLHGVTTERWAEFVNDVLEQSQSLEQSQNDRALIFLADIVQGGTTRYVTPHDRLSTEYRTLKDRVRDKWYEWNNNNIS